MKRLTIWKNGSWLVIFILLLGAVGTGLSIWSYSQHVYSSHDAQVLNNKGLIGAFYPARFAKKIFPHQVARITFQEQAFLLPCKAEVVSVTQTMLGRRHVLLVTLQLLDPQATDGATTWKSDSNLKPGANCSVTIDTTISPLQ